MSLEIRSITEAEHEAWNRVPSVAFSSIPAAERLAQWRALMEFERSVGALESGRFVGTAAGLTFRMTLPGGAIADTGGVTAVGVSPTHRRRGVLTAMMKHQLEDFHARGEAFGVLWASESVIYGRFGYGMAIPGERFEISRAHARFSAASAPGDGERLEIVDRAEALERFPAIYARVAATTPGMLQHPESFWQTSYGDGPWRELAVAAEPFLVIYQRNGIDEGYLGYKVDENRPRTLSVVHLYAATAAAHEALWRYVAGVDLVDEIVAPNRAVDDALPWMLADMRRLRRTPSDMIWLRLVDVPKALAARTYGIDDELVIEVSDAVCPWNAGRYLLQSNGEGAVCKPTNRSADMTIDAASLAVIYLGATPASVLKRARRVAADDAALLRADRLFRTDRAPWCGLDF